MNLVSSFECECMITMNCQSMSIAFDFPNKVSNQVKGQGLVYNPARFSSLLRSTLWQILVVSEKDECIELWILVWLLVTMHAPVVTRKHPWQINDNMRTSNDTAFFCNM